MSPLEAIRPFELNLLSVEPGELVARFAIKTMTERAVFVLWPDLPCTPPVSEGHERMSRMFSPDFGEKRGDSVGH